MVKSRCKPNNTYSIIIKVRGKLGDGNTSYFMPLERQVGFHYSDESDVNERLKAIFYQLYTRIIYYEDLYELISIDILQFGYVVNVQPENLKIKNINKEYLDKDLVKVGLVKSTYNDKYLPITIDESYYGKPIKPEIDESKGIVKSLSVDGIDFLEKIRIRSEQLKYQFEDFDYKTRFYLYTNRVGGKYIISVNDTGEKGSVKNVYDLNGGRVINKVEDSIVDVGRFIRSFRNISFMFSNNGLLLKAMDVKLPLIKEKYSRGKNMTNENIGVFDIETFKDVDDKTKVYALGFTTLGMVNKSEDEQVSMYYLDRDGSTPDEIVLKSINEMIDKYSGYIFYAHNLGGYDAIFIMRILYRYNAEIGNVHYKLDYVFRDNRILKFVIKVKHKSA